MTVTHVSFSLQPFLVSLIRRTYSTLACIPTWKIEAVGGSSTCESRKWTLGILSAKSKVWPGGMKATSLLAPCSAADVADGSLEGPACAEAVAVLVPFEVDEAGTGSATTPSALTLTIGSSVVASSASVDAEGGYRTWCRRHRGSVSINVYCPRI